VKVQNRKSVIKLKEAAEGEVLLLYIGSEVLFEIISSIPFPEN